MVEPSGDHVGKSSTMMWLMNGGLDDLSEQPAAANRQRERTRARTQAWALAMPVRSTPEVRRFAARTVYAGIWKLRKSSRSQIGQESPSPWHGEFMRVAVDRKPIRQ